MFKIIVFCLVFYCALLLVIFSLQRKLMYFPERAENLPSQYGLDMQEIMLSPAGKPKLTAWYQSAQTGYPLIVYYHGNAGNLKHRADKFRAFTQAGFGVLAVSYRGYGASEGIPTEAGLYEDARAVLHYVTSTLGMPVASIILFGESLGSGIAVQMATEHKIGGVVLEAPYISVLQRSGELYPFLPVRFLLRDRYESMAKIKQVSAPLLILHGERDRIIPVAHGRALLEAANQPKRAVFYPEVNHVNFDYAQMVEEMLAFAREHGLLHQ